ncbi:tail fiber protein [Mannheimia sp. AT1]|uniref:Tail fiber protein n=1 Tax=Mannheimia cairinae TaxID=3025936 RepID=A0ABT5MQC6_9PAST|nr:tail fiber protein [Mannheimia cairinae]MDD0824386.1 tail fiber protein [Mannheimia cairinae]MDD0827292.1 tail fiber protein [Mannheimia cairinae]
MAGVQETAQWENHVYRIEENDPVHGGENGVTNKPIKHLANRTLYLRKLLTEAGQRINPKKITATTRNSNDLTGHTHEIDLASLTTKGLVQLTNDTGLDSESLALTAKAGKAIAQSLAQTRLDMTSGLNQKVNKTDISNAVNSSSQTTVASSQAVKTAYDKGVEAKTAADVAQRAANAKQSPATTLSGYGITDAALTKALTTENLNLITTPGLYGQGANANATTQRNYPDTKAGALQVINSAYGVMQTYITYDTRYMFVRNQATSGWSDWVRIDGLDKLPITGGTLLGNLTIQGGSDYNSIMHYNTSGKYTLTQGSPDGSTNFYAVAYFDSSGNREYGAFFPKSGTTEFVAYQSWVNSVIGNYILNSKRSNSTNSTRTDTVATSAAVKAAYDKGAEAKAAADAAQHTADAKQSPATTLSGYGITDAALTKALTTENLNLITTPGLYGQGANANATTQRNYPDTKAGALQVINSAYGVMQTYITYDTRYMFVRNQATSGWSDWVRIDGLDKLPITGGTLLGNLVVNSGDWSKIALLNNSGKQLIVEATPDSSSNIGNIVYRGATNQNEAAINIPRKNGTMALDGDIYHKNRYRYTAYPRHYHGAEVYKIPMSDAGGLMIVTLRADVCGRTTLNLPESFKAANYSVVANDVGGGRIVLSANRASGSQITVIGVDGRDATASIQCIGWVDF